MTKCQHPTESVRSKRTDLGWIITTCGKCGFVLDSKRAK